MAAIDQRMANILWGSNDCQWVFSGSDGMSGGLCCIWDKSVFVRTDLWGVIMGFWGSPVCGKGS